jgi:hypothetical protein
MNRSRFEGSSPASSSTIALSVAGASFFVGVMIGRASEFNIVIRFFARRRDALNSEIGLTELHFVFVPTRPGRGGQFEELAHCRDKHGVVERRGTLKHFAMREDGLVKSRTRHMSTSGHAACASVFQVWSFAVISPTRG